MFKDTTDFGLFEIHHHYSDDLPPGKISDKFYSKILLAQGCHFLGETLLSMGMKK